MIQVLVIDDEAVLARAICNYLRIRGFSTDHAQTAEQGLQKFREQSPAMTLLDYRLGHDDGIELLGRLRAIDRKGEIVMMTGHGDIDVAVRAMKGGARDFLVKPTPLSVIASMAAEITATRVGAVRQEGGPHILGRSTAIQELRERLGRILDAVQPVGSDPPAVMIVGETGTGKELIAQTLHREGPRAAGPFVSINCAALPSHLVEAELFGYERGAFTDAREAKPGLFEAAGGGVLFLDEVGELPLEVQAKLLRVLEERSIRRIGGLDSRKTDVWVVSATNRPLSALVQAGKFRADLMFRLQVLWLEAPPLRSRETDILLLAKHFLTEFAVRYDRQVPALSDDARAALVGHSWPGNVRELRNVMERAVIGCTGGVIEPGDVPFEAAGAARAEPIQGRKSLHDMERAALENALTETGGNVTRAARLLGISRDTLRYRIEKFALKP